MLEAHSYILYIAILSFVLFVALINRRFSSLQSLVDESTDGQAIVKNGKITFSNKRFAELMGASPQALQGRLVDDLLRCTDGSALGANTYIPVEIRICGAPFKKTFDATLRSICSGPESKDILLLRDRSHPSLDHLANCDSLTGLANRRFFDEQLEHVLKNCSQTSESVALLTLDLDRFKAVNDLFGHAEGDRVLRRVADILRSCAANDEIIARIGGDEFAIIQVAAQPQASQRLAQAILKRFSIEMDVAQDPAAVSVSIGIALSPWHSSTAETLKSAADMALYKAKASGRSLLAFYNNELGREIRERRELETDLRNAISAGQLKLALQPQLRADASRLLGFEALLRWFHPERGEIPPDVFIPVAEETGIIIQLGEWVLHQACHAAMRWQKDLHVSVNISPIQLRASNLVAVVHNVLTATGLAPHRLELEITEAALINHRAATLEVLQRLRAMGVKITIDDFGACYSFVDAQNLPFDKLKVDRSFVKSIEYNDSTRAFVRAIVGLGDSLEIPVAAEGVETAYQHSILRNEGCVQLQGRHFCEPKLDMGSHWLDHLAEMTASPLASLAKELQAPPKSTQIPSLIDVRTKLRRS